MEFGDFLDTNLERQRKERFERSFKRTFVYLRLTVSCLLTILPFIISMRLYYKLSTGNFSCETVTVGLLFFCVAITTSFILLRDVYQRLDFLSYVEISFAAMCCALFEVVHYALFTTEALDMLRLYIAGAVIDVSAYYTLIHLAFTFSVYSAIHLLAFHYFVKWDVISDQLFSYYLGAAHTLKRLTQIVAAFYMMYALLLAVCSVNSSAAFESATVGVAQARQRASGMAIVYGATALANLLLIVGLGSRRSHVPDFTLRRINLLLVLAWICLTLLMTTMDMMDIFFWIMGMRDMPIPNHKEVTVLIVAKIGVVNYGLVAIIYYFCQEVQALSRAARGVTTRTACAPRYAASAPRRGIPMPVLFPKGSVHGEPAHNVGQDTYI